MRARLAFTLLEVLMALSLLAVLSITAFGWILTQQRSSRNAQARLTALEATLSVARLLNEDLVLAVPNPSGRRIDMQDPTTLTLTTLDQLPGESAGFHQVQWHIDEHGERVLRRVITAGMSAPDSDRVIVRHLSGLTFALDDRGSPSLRLQPTLSSDSTPDLVIALWNEQ